MTLFRRELPNGYVLQAVETEPFGALWVPHGVAIFDEGSFHMYSPKDALSAPERERSRALRERVRGAAFRLNLAVYHREEFVGWSWGYQESAGSGDTFYMCNSAVLPPHRGQGLYSALVAATLELATAEGFQKIYSRHVATNNAVIVPKLKRGFTISGFELSDCYGLLVYLSYYPNAMRRKMADYRAGLIRPDEEMKELLRL